MAIRDHADVGGGHLEPDFVRRLDLRYRSLGAITLTFERRQGNLEGAVRLPGR